MSVKTIKFEMLLTFQKTDLKWNNKNLRAAMIPPPFQFPLNDFPSTWHGKHCY